MPRGDTDAVYEGAAGRTRSEAIHWSCPCGQVVCVMVVRAVDVARDAALAQEARAGALGRVTCPACNSAGQVEVAFVYHDASLKKLVLVLPPSARHRELDERAAFLGEMARDRSHRVPAYARDFAVAFGADGLRAELARPRATTAGVAPAAAGAAASAELTRRAAELDAREARLTRRAAELDAREAKLALRRGMPDDPQTGPFGRLPGDPAASIDDEDADAHIEGSGAHLLPDIATAPPEGLTRPGARAASRDLAVERWIASREPARALAEHGKVRLLARPSTPRLEELQHGQLVPKLQLFRMAVYPLVVLSVRAFASMPDADAPVAVLLDLQRIDDRAVLGALAAGFRVELVLFDADHQLVAARTIGAPLEDNVRAIITAAEEHLKSLPAGRSFEAAATLWRGAAFDRHGRRAHSLEEDSFSHLPSAAATQVALTVVGFWSEPEHQDYLVLERAFPLPWWRRIRSRVVGRAVELGLQLPASLTSVAVGEGLARSRKDLAGKLARAFAETCARGSDLDAGQVQDNWRAIVAECEALGVALEGSAADLAAQSVGAPHTPTPGAMAAAGLPRRTPTANPTSVAQGTPVPAPAVAAPAASAPAPATMSTPTQLPLKDLSTDAKNREVLVARRAMSSPVIVGEIGAKPAPKRDLARASTKELIELLDDKDVRKDAAIELSRRADPAGLGPVFGAIRRMARGEAVRVLPHVVGFGERAVPHLLDGLRSRKGFLRHGCALALGILKSGEGVEPLCDLLLSEPTEVWREIARAVGVLGPGAVMPLAARLREAQVDRRDRISWALAHIAARGGRGPIETLAAGRDGVAQAAAKRALELSDQARVNDAEVRGTAPARDQTVNRAFSRRFFEAMQNGTTGTVLASEVELSADDAEVIEEGPDDAGDEELLDEEDLIPG